MKVESKRIRRRKRVGSRNGDKEQRQDVMYRIYHHMVHSTSTVGFLLEVAKVLTDSTDCDSVEFRVLEGRQKWRFCESVRRPQRHFKSGVFPLIELRNGLSSPAAGGGPGFHLLCEKILSAAGDSKLKRTESGSFWTNDTRKDVLLSSKRGRGEESMAVGLNGRYGSLAIIPLLAGKERMGVVLLKSRRRNFFCRENLALSEKVARNFAVALAYQLKNVELEEQVGELTCLYGISRLFCRRDLSLDKVLDAIVANLPSAWQYSELASARIVLDGVTYPTPGFKDGLQKQHAEIIVDGRRRGFVEVNYSQRRPDLDEGPFLARERTLLGRVAGEIANILKQRQADNA